jgi:hypothetical protein
MMDKTWFALILVAALLVSCTKEKTVVQVEYAPVLYDVVAPDSLQRGSVETAYIFIRAFDPDGLENIDSVYFVSTRPDGSSNGVHFYMFDDGSTYEDSVAGDGQYTIGIQPPDNSSQSGDYVFTFYAFDNESNPSNNPQHIVTAY